MEISKLLKLSMKARQNSYAPYSNYTVGAALLASDDKIYTGCNIENASFSPTNCAERTAIFKAVSEGKREFKAIAICGGVGEKIMPSYPCGVCRQVLIEFCDPETFKIIVAISETEYETYLLKELLPHGFSLGY